MTRNALALPLMLLFPLLLHAEEISPKTVPSAEAESHIVEKIEPTVPPLAKMAKIGGKVRLRIVISASGDVSSVKAITGHPLLVQAAIEATKKWKYRPFVQGGMRIPVETEVELDFPGGMGEQDSAARNRFYPAEDECQELLKTRKYAEAERKCREVVEISNKLPEDLILERSRARALLANSLYMQKRFQEAIPLYEEALALDKGYRKPNDADLATDYANLGGAYAVTGQLAKADGLFATAVSTFEAAIQNLPEMKENYKRRLKRTLNEYAQVKEVEGQSEAAGELRAKAAGL
jgi:TonB family protein